jgi:eukaryotic-like serine/threonine-protein kinase
MDSALGTGRGLLGQVLANRYRIVERIGAGGMATIYRGHDESLERDVAVKVLHGHLADDDGLQARFRTEARHAAGLLHPNIVNVFDQGVADLPYIVMEHVDGPSLREILLQRGLLTPAETLSVMDPVCQALARAHTAGVVHRDVKPENVLIGRDGAPKVADFGIARAVAETSHTQTGTLIGSVHYMAPELIDGQEATPASDQYAAGVLLFELLTGRKPLTADTPMAVAVRHTRERIPPAGEFASDIPKAVDRVILRATEPDPSRRFPDMLAMAAALRAAVPGGASPLVVRRDGERGETLVIPPAAQETMSITAAADVATRQPKGRRRPAPPRGKAPGRGRGRRGRSRLRTVGIVLLSLLLLGGAGAGAAWAVWNYVVAPVTEVPGLVGSTEAQAEATLADLGLVLVVDQQVHDLDAPAGEVLEQDPPAGTELRRGEEVEVVVSLGVADQTVPRVVGSPQDAAVELLEGSPYHYEVEIDEAHSDDVAAGQVISQVPEAGEDLAQRDTVTIVVSLGIEQVEVPDLSGMDRDEAAAALEDAGLRASFEETFSDEVPQAGRVIRQSTAAGQEADKGATVTVTVSRGPLTVDVPNVRGKSLAEGRAQVEAAGLRVRVEEQPRPRIGPFRQGQYGRVEEQVPSPGSRAQRGETVTLYTFSEAAERSDGD